MKKLYRYLFNPHTGYYLKFKFYYDKGVPFVVHVVCQGYKFFGLTFFDTLFYTPDISEVNQFAKLKQVTIK